MQKANKIAPATRRAIADRMAIESIGYSGKLDEASFLARLFDLQSKRSNDYRYDNAYDDIRQHMVNNHDWDDDWIYSDPRINLLHAEDQTYLRFLAETVHPVVRTDQAEISKLLGIYNQHLENDGLEIIQSEVISGKTTYIGTKKVFGQANLAIKREEIRKYLDTSYVNDKITLMNSAVNTNTDLAIGTAKELLETCCKSIMKQKQALVDKDWTLPRLIKETASVLNFKPREAEFPDKAEASIKQILSGISTIVQGVTELRNAYGTGHGKDADFKGIETKYAKLLAGVVAEIAIIFLATNGEKAELIEEQSAHIF